MVGILIHAEHPQRRMTLPRRCMASAMRNDDDDAAAIVHRLTPPHQAMVNAQIIPEGDSVFFSNWAGPTELPSPDEVREHYNVLDRRASVIVRLFHLDLVVKYGPHVRAAEGQALWVIEHFTDVRAPTVYGWFQDGAEMFLYMSLVDGVTL